MPVGHETKRSSFFYEIKNSNRVKFDKFFAGGRILKKNSSIWSILFLSFSLVIFSQSVLGQTHTPMTTETATPDVTATPEATATAEPTATPESGSFVLATDDFGYIYYAACDGAGNFSDYAKIDTIPGSGKARGIVIHDFDRDGDLDFIAGRHHNGKRNHFLYLNDGSDNFTLGKLAATVDSSDNYANDFAVGDFNNDGFADFISGENTGNVHVHLNDGDGSFSSALLELGGYGRGMDAADLDNDGNLDFVRGTYSNGLLKAYMGLGDGTFSEGEVIADAGTDPYGVVCGDFDNDGYADVIGVQGNNGDSSFFRNLGDGTWSDMGYISSLDLNNHCAYDAFDYNGDGNLDIVAVDYSGRGLWFYPGTGGATFGARIQINQSGITGYTLGVSAPPYGQWPYGVPAGCPRPEISPSFQTIPKGGFASFSGENSTDPGGGIIGWDWTFGDGGATSGSSTVMHPYTTEGDYIVRLKVTDTDGNRGYAYANVLVQGAIPTGDAGGPYDFDESYASEGVYTVPLNGTGSSDTEGIAEYKWATGDGFSDDFESGALSDWFIYGGSWSAAGGVLTQSDTDVERAVVYYNAPGSKHLSKYRIDVDVTINGGSEKRAVLLFRGQDSVNNYELALQGGFEPAVILTKWQNGTETSLLGKTILSGINEGQEYRLSAEAEGTRLRAYLDDELIMEVQDDAPFGAGWVGLGSDYSSVTFDDFQVTTLGVYGALVFYSYYLGTYDVTLTVTDHAGQTDEDSTTIVCGTSDPPVADPGGPYVLDESRAVCGSWLLDYDGSGSSDDYGIEMYQWNFGVDDFDGSNINEVKWIVSEDVTQNGVMEVDGSGLWGERYVFSQDNYPRVKGMFIQARVMPRSGRVMWGFKNTGLGYSYTNMPYAIYFDNGNVKIFEYGADRGTITTVPLEVWYDVKIELKETAGARYYYREYGETEWILLFDSVFSSETPLKRGMTVQSGTHYLDDFQETAAGESGTYHVYESGDASLTVMDQAQQTDTQTTTVTVTGNDPPESDAGPDMSMDEHNAFMGTWNVQFDGSGTTDDFGICTYEWDFGDGSTGTGVNPTHTYFATGEYDVSLTVTDNALQQDTDHMDLTISPNDPPVADAGGPYVVNEDEAMEGKWTIMFDGNGSSDDVGLISYRWDVSPDSFDGIWINLNKWFVSNYISQNNQIRLEGSTWGTRFIFSQDTYQRGSLKYITAKVKSEDGRFMWGLKDTGPGFTYTNMPYAIYFDTGTLKIYEDGWSRGVVGSYDYDQWYEVKIELKSSTGAKYYYREEGAGEWSLLYNSDYGDDEYFSKGMVAESGVQYMDDFGEAFVGPTLLYNIYGECEATLTVMDNARQTDSDVAEVVVIGGGPTANAGGPYFSHLDAPIMFDGSNSTDDIALVQFLWDFGDGNTGGGERPFHTYTTLPEFDSQWAISATASSERGSSSYSAMQATGAPDVNSCTDSASAWASSSSDMGEQWLELTYAEEMEIELVTIHETYNPGFVTKIDGYNAQNELVTIWTGTDDTVCNGYLAATISPAFLTDTIRIYCDTDVSGWNEIDAVRISEHPPDQVSYTVSLTVIDQGGHTDTATTTVFLDVAPMTVCVPWQFDAGQEVPHPVWYTGNGGSSQTNEVTFKATAKGIFTPLTYTWDFGDGATDGPHMVTDKLAIEATHQYTGVSEDQPIYASLTIRDAMGNETTDDYLLIVRPKNLEVEADVAIDNGLWYLHKTQNRTPGSDFGAWRYNSSYSASSTASCIQAFEINGHLEIGDMKQDPYVETVIYGMRYLFTTIDYYEISEQTAGDPDTNDNGIGLTVTESRPIYQGGMVMDAIAASSTPDARAETGSVYVLGKTYKQILTDMMDMYAWGQGDSGGDRGGWRYNWNSDADNSACQWASIGIMAARDYAGVTAPEWVKDENLIWLNYSRYGSLGTYGYTSSSSGGSGWNATTASGLVQLAFCGIDTEHAHWEAAEDYFADRWSSFMSSDNTYAFYAFAKAMRLAVPEPVINLEATGLDWFENPTSGMKRYLVNDQNANGSWNSGSGWPGANASLSCPWSIIILTSALFTRPPVAVIESNGSAVTELYWGQGVQLCLDGSGSYHLDPTKDIVSYSWDMNGDGIFDDCDSPQCCYTWDEMGDHTAALRVVDNADPPQMDTAYCIIHIVEPPHAPFSVIGGPYECTAGLPCEMDGSASYDIDPGDEVTEWWWDLDGHPWEFTTYQGGPEMAVITHIFDIAGTKQIGLKVWDNGVFNEGVKLDDNSYTTVLVAQNVAPVAEAGGPYTIFEGVELTLDGTASYDPNGDPIDFAWDLDNDGQYDDSSDDDPEYTWMDNGPYMVGLEVTDTLLQGYDTANVNVLDQGPDAAVTGDSELYINEMGSYDAGGSSSFPDEIVLYEWDWNYNGFVFVSSGDEGPTQTHSWDTAGTYNAAVRVVDDDGSANVAYMPVNVNDPPTATPTATPTDTPTLTPTATLSATPTLSPTPTSSPTFTPSGTPTDAPTSTPTNTETPLPTETPTDTPIYTSTPTIVPTPAPIPAVGTAGAAILMLLLGSIILFARRKK